MFIYCMFTNTGSMQSARLTESILYVHLLHSMANRILSVLYSYSQYSMAHLHQKKQHPFLCNTPFLLQSLHKPIAAKNQLTCLLQQTDITCKFRRQTCAVGERGAEAEAAAAALVEPRVQVLHHQPTSSRSKTSCWSKSSSSPCRGRLPHAVDFRSSRSSSGGGARGRGGAPATGSSMDGDHACLLVGSTNTQSSF